jgi:glycerophosphoryl diester phosphodiesterase
MGNVCAVGATVYGYHNLLYTRAMQVIGHRGVAGVKLENSRESFELAVELNLSAVELDVRVTADRQLVVCHDADIQRVAQGRGKIRSMSLASLKSIKLNDGSTFLTLTEALEILRGRHIIIEVKDSGCTDELLSTLKDFDEEHISIASFRLKELVLLQSKSKRYDYYGLTKHQPFDIIHFARIFNLNGVGLNYWLLNPLTYYLIRRAGLKIYIYTSNNPLVTRLILRLYPQTAVCTDRPDLFIRAPMERGK